jgi:diacylglycerol kinase family enzyme
MSVRAASGWAVVALVALALSVSGLVVVMVGSEGAFLAVVLEVVVSLAVVAATAWWAFTTRRVWKRWLNVAVAVLVVAALAVNLIIVGLAEGAGLAAMIVGLLGYGGAARRALAGDSSPAPVADVDEPPARPWLLVNLKSGGGKAERSGLVGAAQARGISVHVLVPGDDPTALARRAVADGADAVGVAGGDGSLGLVAAVAVEAGVPFVCIPVGTRNHFAADLGLDRAHPLAALDAFTGKERRIDVGMVGDRVFVNNVSLGAYADVVAEPSYRAEKLATARTVLLGPLRGERALLQVDFHDPDGHAYRDVLVLLVANNSYELSGAATLGARARLDDGLLQVSALRARTGAALAGLAARITSGRVASGANWAQWTAAKLRVDAQVSRLPAGIDGEAVELAAPLEFRILPRALRVLVPAGLRPPPPQVRVQSWATLRRLATIAVRGPAAPLGVTGPPAR